MAGIRGKDTNPELVLRRLLHKLGYRFRLHRNDLPGRPDIVLPKHRTVIFANGCFWHGHANCHLFRLPKTRTDFWNEKISKNIVRDQLNKSALIEQDWNVLEVWECALRGKRKLPIEEIAAELVSFISKEGPAAGNLRGNQTT